MKIERIVVGDLQANCYIVAADNNEACVIDPGDDVHKIKAMIKKHNVNVQFVINTHSHRDHIKENYNLGFPVFVHKDEAEALEDPKKNISSSLLGKFTPCKPARLLEDGDRIALGNLVLEIIHTPGHSPGGICIKVGNVIFTGDTLFREGVGRTDFPDGSSQQLFEAIKNKLLCFSDDVVIYPGHGPSSTIGQERRNLNFYV